MGHPGCYGEAGEAFACEFGAEERGEFRRQEEAALEEVDAFERSHEVGDAAEFGVAALGDGGCSCADERANSRDGCGDAATARADGEVPHVGVTVEEFVAADAG